MGNDDHFSMKNLSKNSQFVKLTPKQQQLVAESEDVIRIAYLTIWWKYPTASYEDLYGNHRGTGERGRARDRREKERTEA